jgi:hypothetical protein
MTHAAASHPRDDSALAPPALRIYATRMHKQFVALAVAASAIVLGAVACSSSSSTGGTSETGDSGAGSDSGTADSGSGDAASAGCIPVGAPGNALGVGKYCATEADCSGQTANLCALVGGATEDFCTFFCTAPVDGGADPCGDNANCQCQGGQCGCTPLACQ